jgi:hypothetical protein
VAKSSLEMNAFFAKPRVVAEFIDYIRGDIALV